MKTNKLWKVTAKNDRGFGSSLPEGDLLIIAKSVEQATMKAVRWLKKNQYFTYKVTRAEFEGTIDVF